ncbi:hypothetical protein BD626DRAFT_230244 [Schizophyllum amplum]|uniref:Uncharacterized protein n=1 Tax=Schizophyllum amplum TaxID=97359 RepID=A0A550BWI1_9AGAR|nr:hypothetical protein BD626DRAFT_230244 [Auriculariopsis ampla]
MAAEAAAELLKRSRPAQMRALRLRCDSVSEISLAHIVAVAPGLEELRIYLKDGARHATHSELCAALASEAPPGLRFLALSASRQWFSEVGLQACPQLMTFAPPIRPNATATNQTFPSLISAIQMRAPGLAVIQLLADNLTAQTSARSSGEVVFIPKTKSAATSRAASPAAATSRSYLPFDIFADVAREQNDCEGARGSIAVSLVSPIRVPETVDSWANMRAPLVNGMEAHHLPLTLDPRYTWTTSGCCRTRTILRSYSLTRSPYIIAPSPRLRGVGLFGDTVLFLETEVGRRRENSVESEMDLRVGVVHHVSDCCS